MLTYFLNHIVSSSDSMRFFYGCCRCCCWVLLSLVFKRHADYIPFVVLLLATKKKLLNALCFQQFDARILRHRIFKTIRKYISVYLSNWTEFSLLLFSIFQTANDKYKFNFVKCERCTKIQSQWQQYIRFDAFVRTEAKKYVLLNS